MSDPKNIPLDQARPGDIVHLKPMMVDNVSPQGFVSVGHQWFPPSVIDRIERAPRPLEVGDRVRFRTGSQGFIRAIRAEFNGKSRAWVEFTDSAGCYTSPYLTDLERVDG